MTEESLCRLYEVGRLKDDEDDQVSVATGCETRIEDFINHDLVLRDENRGFHKPRSRAARRESRIS